MWSYSRPEGNPPVGTRALLERMVSVRVVNTYTAGILQSVPLRSGQ